MQIAYLLGIPRSGTTLLSALLNQHLDVYCPAEPWTMLATASFGTVPAANAADSELIRKASAIYLGDPALHHDIAVRIYSGMLAGKSATYIVDKTPRYHHCLDYIGSTMPEAKYLWIVRNPLDVAASYKSTWNNDVIAALRDGIDHAILFDFALGLRRLLDFARTRHVHMVRYEDLVSTPATVMSGVFDYLGLRAPEFNEDIVHGMKPLLGSAFGDTKIAQTTSIHNRSVGRYVETLGEEGARLLCAMMGRELLSDLSYPELYDRHDAGSVERATELPGNIEHNARRLEKLRKSLSIRPYTYWQQQRSLAGAHRVSARNARHATAASDEALQYIGTHIAASDEALQYIGTRVAACDEALQHIGARVEASDEALQHISTRVAASDEALQYIGTRVAACDEALQHIGARVEASDEALQHISTRVAASDEALQYIGTRVAACDEALQHIGARVAASDEVLQYIGTRTAASDEALQHIGARVEASDAMLRHIGTHIAASEEVLQKFGALVAALKTSQEQDRAIYLKARDDAAELADQLRKSDDLRKQEIENMSAHIRELRRSPLARLLGKDRT